MFLLFSKMPRGTIFTERKGVESPEVNLITRFEIDNNILKIFQIRDSLILNKSLEVIEDTRAGGKESLAVRFLSCTD